MTAVPSGAARLVGWLDGVFWELTVQWGQGHGAAPLPAAPKLPPRTGKPHALAAGRTVGHRRATLPGGV